MQNCPRRLVMQSCVLCSFVRCGSCNQIEKEKKKESFADFYKTLIRKSAWVKFVSHNQRLHIQTNGT